MDFFHTAAVRRVTGAAIVCVLILCGLLVLAFNLMADKQNLDAAGNFSDVGAVRLAAGWVPLLALPWYRKNPLMVIALGAVMAVFAQADPFALSVGLTVWMSRADRPWQHWVTGAGIGVIVINAAMHIMHLWQWPDNSYSQSGTILAALQATLAILLIVGISTYIRQHHRVQVAQSEAASVRMENVDLQDDLFRQQEREELAREVHDTLASRLSTIAMQAGSLEDANSPQLSEAAHAVRTSAAQALDDLRSLLASLRQGNTAEELPPEVIHGSLSDVIELMEDATHSGLSIHPFVALDDYRDASDALRRAVYRITQEALANALRYSSDHTLYVHIEGNPGSGIQMEFRNRYSDDPGFTGGAGKGLLGVEERLALLGGSMVRSEANGWFSLRVSLPWRTAEVPA